MSHSTADTIEPSRNVGSYRSKLDTLTEDILSKSSSTLEKIEENIRLTHSLRLSFSLIAQMDSRIDLLTQNLHQYQHYLSQLNSLMMRAEFFEAQLNMLEAEQQVNSMRTRRGLPCLKNWKDEDLNWRTTSASLENLSLEYRFLSRKIQLLSSKDLLFSNAASLDPSSFIYQDPEPTLSHDIQQRESTEPKTLQERFDTNVKLKPIRCSSKPHDSSSRRTSLNLSINLLTNSIITTPKRQQDQLPSPDTTMDSTMFSHSSPTRDTTTVTPPLAREEVKSPLSSRTRSTTHRHTRCKSSPFVFKDLMLGGADTEAFDLPIPARFNLRHFISHDTGLTTKVGAQKMDDSEDEEGVKDSEFLNSPSSYHITDFMKLKNEATCQSNADSPDTLRPETDETITTLSKIHEESHSEGSCEDGVNFENSPSAAKAERSISLAPAALTVAASTTTTGVTLNEPPNVSYVEEYGTELPTFQHKLNRSNSCDSIFSVMTTRIPLQPGKDSRSQTLLWMKKFSKPQAPSVGNASAVSTVSARNQLALARGSCDTKQTLSNLVAQAKTPEPTAPSNGFSFWFSSRPSHNSQSTTTTSPPEELPEPVVTVPASETIGSSFLASFLNSKSKPAARKTSPLCTSSEGANKSLVDTFGYQSFGSKKAPLPRESAVWPRLINSFAKQPILKPACLVTSEVGKRSPAPTSQPTNAETCAWNVSSRETIKGSFSTLTMGPHGSKIVQHGETSSMSQSLVVTSRVSHAALKDALNNELIFEH